MTTDVERKLALARSAVAAAITYGATLDEVRQAVEDGIAAGTALRDRRPGERLSGLPPIPEPRDAEVSPLNELASALGI